MSDELGSRSQWRTIPRHEGSRGLAEVIGLLERDGWVQVRMRGSHRQFKHPSKPGLVTVAGKPSIDIPPGTLYNILKQASERIAMRYLVVVEEDPTSFGAHVPDLPGCVAVAETRNEVLALIKEVIEFHIQGLRDEGIEIPNPHVSSEFVDVQAA
jgi:predicted RNA binding protein YcfA (HicA-like mRNA interferase family)/predicted RNase H-like HicB family nuclease